MQEPHPVQSPASEYLRTVRATQLTNLASTSKLMQLFLYEPTDCILIGMHNEVHYRLVPCTDALIVEDERIDRKDKREIVDQVFLGVNTKIEPKTAGIKRPYPVHRRRDQATSDQSTSSNDSTVLNDSSGFTFVQLGLVEYISDKLWRIYQNAKTAPENMVWRDTNFVLVVMINSSGFASEAGLIYNFNPEDPMEGERYPVNKDEVNWGFLENNPEQRAGFRIAEEVWKLGPTVNWSIDQVMYDLDLVAAVIVQQQTGKMVVRQKLFEDPKQIGKDKGKMPLRR